MEGSGGNARLLQTHGESNGRGARIHENQGSILGICESGQHLSSCCVISVLALGQCQDVLLQGWCPYGLDNQVARIKPL